MQGKGGRGVTAVSDSHLMQMSVTQWVPCFPSFFCMVCFCPSQDQDVCLVAEATHVHEQQAAAQLDCMLQSCTGIS